LCMPIVRQEAKEQGKSLKAHLAHLLIHGCLHAQGHDHMNTAQTKKMEALEIKLLASIGFANPY
jgi:probable rRNA maturation factor